MEILENKPGKKVILLGNEAICRGALEEGVNFVSTYPGTPASEIGNVFYKIAKKAGVYFEFSTNEKVAMEAAAGASLSGLHSLVAMKNFGLNVASDFLHTLMYTGIRAGMVIFVADDPSCWSSAQSEQNTRYYSQMAHCPILEPSTPQECKDFTRFAFELSEKFKIPIMIRTTTRASHQSAPVILGKIIKKVKKAKFIKDPHQFSTMPPRVLEMKRELLEKIEKIQKFSEKLKINKIENSLLDPAQFFASQKLGRGTSRRVAIENCKLGIVTSGVSYLYVMESLKELNLKLPVLKLGFIYPLPEEKIKNFIKNLKKVLVVEELEPYLEREVERLAKNINCDLEIMGKNLLPEVGELKPETITLAIAKVTNSKFEILNPKQIQNSKFQIPKRYPQLCPGCPYWLVVSAVKKAVDQKEVIFGGEIGCYMLFRNPPIEMQDYLSCMGSSVGIAHGIKKATGPAFAKASAFDSTKSAYGQTKSAGKQKLITFIGDSSFFHAGIPALINTVFNKSNPLIIILENQTTAMTGHQPHPGAPAEPNGIKIEEIVKACGVKNLKVIDPIRQDEFINTVKEFLTKDEVSVIIARHPCKFVKKT